MRLFTSQTAICTTTRCEGYYPNRRQAEYFARKICLVLGDNSDSRFWQCADALHGRFYHTAEGFHDTTGDGTKYHANPMRDWLLSDRNVVECFLAWWSKDEEVENDTASLGDLSASELACRLSNMAGNSSVFTRRSQKCFLCVNLNTGKTLIVTDR